MTENCQPKRSISDLDAQLTLELLKTGIAQGDDPEALLAQCREGLEDVGARFEAGEYFTADLMYAASIFKDAMSILGPQLRRTMQVGTAGKVVIATVQDDIHDVGKNLVSSMLDAAGFEVNDLGVDVPPSVICDSIREGKPDVVALSCLLTTTVDSMEETIAEIARSGLRDAVKIVVGGIPITRELATSIGADAYGDNAYEAVTVCRQLLGVSKDER